MTADQYRDALKSLSLTQAGGARLLGVDERTSRRWAIGERDVPPPVARFLAFMIATGTTADQVMKVLTPK